MLFSFDKLTTGTCSFVSVILTVAADGTTIAGLSPSASLVAISAETQFFDQVKISSTSQLIGGIFKLLQKLLKCFNVITTSAFFNESLSSGVFPTIFVLYLKDSEQKKENHLAHLCNNSTKSSALSICTPLIFEMQLINGALFLKARFLFRLLASLSPSRVIVPFTTIYGSVKSHKSDLSIDILILISLLKM